jgi:hypothetical protein
VPTDIDPGTTGELIVGMGDNCYPNGVSPTFTHLRLVLPGGAGTLVADSTFQESCGSATIGPMGRPPPPVPVPNPSPTPGTVGSLRAHADVPSQVQGGTKLTYTVTLTNDSGVAVPLSPCPSYTEFINPGTVTSRSFYLNCDHVTTIPSGASVGYAMELNVPPIAPTTAQTPAKFGWSLNTLTSPYARGGAAILVTP